MRRAETPNLETQEEIKALAQDSTVMEDKGTASGHLEVLSIMVRMLLGKYESEVKLREQRRDLAGPLRVLVRGARTLRGVSEKSR